MRVKKWALMGILCGTMVLLAGCGKAQKAYKQAVALAENGSYVKAAASFKEAIAENKDKAEYYIDYGMTLSSCESSAWSALRRLTERKCLTIPAC